ncbi:DUF4870 domain-containing protein [Bacillus sp. FJAT-29814]|uniref:DUF4870 domain-containing protein n=1 Tax=Bacillus sp. FJAT-29814 TaxID=1729688 RepID=UPI0008295183|nr:DUF4870 domain-containing protein [Bacillus sp. FJAT-29814]
MESRKVLSSLCYFSIFFAGFIFPLVVLIASGDEITKKHAKSALLSHLIPLITVPLLIFSLVYEFASMEAEIPVFTIIAVILMVLVSINVVIWNIIKGVKVLIAE